MGFFIVNGLISGMILAAFLALCDALFHTTTFTVLIDVSYVPVLAGLPAMLELLVHLAVSILITAVFCTLYPRFPGPPTARYLLWWAALLSVLYLPFSLLSGQPLSFSAFLIWLIGHVIYTLFLAIQMEKHR
ncbi:hypothetical protein G3578_13710 [Brevibacillus sp. SYP-B805]|uniref:hypothetical protein n=1 Tax=Brevibacillus sp. SYP-B805 TaxID=1578199 RepID=UPI0013ED4720|nr:hypothetical protein [Brevibacillus sp. SYP-B805]NGQ96217.1 hypothetical protein [Brevibacillus sp. SYP-B805]